MRVAGLAIVVGAALVATVATPRVFAAGEFNMGVKAGGIRLGGQVSGAAVTAESLRHKVVMLQFWGLQCPPCIASMPKLEALHQELGPAGLVIIGAHAQGGPADRLLAGVKELGVTFPIVEEASVDGGMDFSGIPHCMVFDHTGACIFRGSPTDAAGSVAAAVRAAPAGVLEGRRLQKLAALEGKLRNESAFGQVLREVEAKLSAKDAALVEEARFVVEKLTGRGRAMLDEARDCRADDPCKAADLVQRCAASFKGCAIGTEATGLIREWKKDKAFVAACRAGQQLEQLRAFRERAGIGKGQPNATAALPPVLRRQIEELVRGVHKSAPGSEMARQADAIAAEFGLGGSGS